jgi:hypothetical protein
MKKICVLLLLLVFTILPASISYGDDVEIIDEVQVGVQEKAISIKNGFYSEVYQNDDGSMTSIIKLTPNAGDNLDVVIADEEGEKAKYKRKMKIDLFEEAEGDNMATIELENCDGDIRTIGFALAIDNVKQKGIKKSDIDSKNVRKINDELDIQFDTKDTELKETLIVHSPLKDYSFTYIFDLDENIELVQNDKIIEIKDRETYEVLAIINHPFAYDSSEEPLETFEWKYKLKALDSSHTELTMELNDTEFLKNAKYPVYIDPTITITDGILCYTFDDNPNYDPDNTLLQVRDDEAGSTEDEDYGVIRFPNDIPPETTIKDAKIHLFVEDVFGYLDADSDDYEFTVHPIIEEWDPNNGELPAYGAGIVTINYEYLQNQWIEIDVTDIMQDHVNNWITNYGFVLIPKSVYSDVHVEVEFSIPGDVNEPYLEVVYTESKNLFRMSYIKTWPYGDYDNEYLDRMYVYDDEDGTIRGEYHCGIVFDLDEIIGTHIHQATLEFNLIWITGYRNFYINKAMESWNVESDEPISEEIAYIHYLSFFNGEIYEDDRVFLDITDTCRSWVGGNGANFGLTFESKEVNSGDSTKMRILESGYELHDEPVLLLDYSYYPDINTVNTPEGFYLKESLSPEFMISDADNQSVACELFIDDQTVPYDSVTINATDIPQSITFSSIDPLSLTEGAHVIKIVATDERSVVREVSYNFTADTVSPDVVMTPVNKTESTISIEVSASDLTAGLAENAPYRYILDNYDTGWVSSNEFQIDNLSPGESYTVECQVMDKAGNITIETINVSTLPIVPTIDIMGMGSDYATVKVTDNNPVTTEYFFMVNDQYVKSDYSLTADVLEAAWFTFADNEITLSGLAVGTPYDIKVKARNNSLDESAYSPIVGFTLTGIGENELKYIKAAKQSGTVQVSWNGLVNAASYEISIDGIVQTTAVNNYSYSEGLLSSPIKVRAFDSGGYSITPWSSEFLTPVNESTRILRIINTSGEYTDLAIYGEVASNQEMFEYEIEYDELALSLFDASLLSSAYETTVGNYPGAGMAITNIGVGTIGMQSTICIGDVGVYRGLINAIRFENLMENKTDLTITILD